MFPSTLPSGCCNPSFTVEDQFKDKAAAILPFFFLLFIATRGIASPGSWITEVP